MMEAALVEQFPLNKGGSAEGAGVVLMSAGKPETDNPLARSDCCRSATAVAAPPPLLRGNVVRF